VVSGRGQRSNQRPRPAQQPRPPPSAPTQRHHNARAHGFLRARRRWPRCRPGSTTRLPSAQSLRACSPAIPPSCSPSPPARSASRCGGVCEGVPGCWGSSPGVFDPAATPAQGRGSAPAPALTLACCGLRQPCRTRPRALLMTLPGRRWPPCAVGPVQCLGLTQTLLACARPSRAPAHSCLPGQSALERAGREL
jgi:hypothetical protein